MLEIILGPNCILYFLKTVLKVLCFLGGRGCLFEEGAEQTAINSCTGFLLKTSLLLLCAGEDIGY